MKHVYTNQETQVSLWEDDYDDELPYVIKIRKRIVFRCDESADAYREYNRIIERVKGNDYYDNK